MLKKVAVALAFTLSLSIPFAVAADKVHKEGQIEIWHPDGWTEKHDHDALTLEDKDGHVLLDLEMVKAKDLKEALKEFEKDVERLVTKVKIVKQEEKKVNGLDALWIDATGESHGKPVHLYCDFVITPTHHVLMILTIVDKDKWDAFEKDLHKIYDSIKPHKD